MDHVSIVVSDSKLTDSSTLLRKLLSLYNIKKKSIAIILLSIAIIYCYCYNCYNTDVVVIASPAEGESGTHAPKKKCIPFGRGKFKMSWKLPE